MVKKLLRPVREYKRDSLLALIFVCLEVVMEMMIPFFMANIMDMGMANGDMPYILKIGLVLAALLSLGFGALSGKYAARAPPVLLKICGRICSIISRIFPFPTSTNFPRQALSPGSLPT